MSYVKLWKALRNGELRSLREIVEDRALMLAALFSVVLHAALFTFLGDWPEKPPTRPPAIMVARLLKPVVPAPVEVPEEVTGEKDIVDPGEEELSDPGPDNPPDREDGATILPGDLGITASLAAGSGAAPLPAVGRLHLDTPVAARNRARAVAAPVSGVSRGGSSGRLDISPSTSAAGRERDFRSAILEIRERIESKKTYPLLARRRGWEGEVLVEIVLGGAGELEGLRLLRYSGFPLLDRATLTAVRAAVPFPPVPGRVKIPVSYRLVPD